MSASAFIDACGFLAASSGTGSFVVSSAITGYQTPASAGAVNATVYSYRAESADKTQWEEGFGAYTTSGTTLARTTITANSSGGSSAINFSNAPNVYITALSTDLLCLGTTRAANNVLAGPTSGGAAAPSFRSLVAADLPFTASQITNSIGGNVTLNNVSTFFDGPSVAQGATGVWFASGTVSCQDNTGAGRFDAKLWDGTTVIAAASNTSGGTSFLCAISLSGYMSSPAGNLRISVRDASSTNGVIFALSSGIGGATISAFRIA